MCKGMQIVLLACCVLCWSSASARSKSGGGGSGSRTPAAPIKLYYLLPSPPCRAVLLAARAAHLDLQLVPTNLMEGEHLKPDFIKMNPQHTIPTMDDNGFILWESRAIMQYLQNAYGKEESLYPRNPRLRALVDQRLQFDQGTLYHRYLDVYQPMIFSGAAMDEPKADKLREALGWLDAMLEGRPFVAGENLTLADISIIVTVTNLDFFGFELSAYERVTAWYERAKKVLEPFGQKDVNEAGAQVLKDFLDKQQG